MYLFSYYFSVLAALSEHWVLCGRCLCPNRDKPLTALKCDEAHPVCKSCQRHNLPCVYDRTLPAKSESSGARSTGSDATAKDTKTEKSTAPVSITISTPDNDSNHEDLPESRSRRMLELKLLQHFIMKTSLTLLGSPEKPLASSGYRDSVQHLALTNDALLYAIHSITAAHLAKTSSFKDREANASAHQRYFDRALRLHQYDIAHLDKENADAVCITSTFVRVTAFVTLQERHISSTSYMPPLNWLLTTAGAAKVFTASWDWISDDQDSVTMQLIARSRVLNDIETLFRQIDMDALSLLLRRSPEYPEASAEPWTPETEEVYANTINYITSVRLALENKEVPLSMVCRRLIVFPMIVQALFIEMVVEGRPRALVVLAWYFGLLSLFQRVWWIGDTGRKEVLGLKGMLGEEWFELLEWPIGMLDRETVDYEGGD